MGLSRRWEHVHHLHFPPCCEGKGRHETFIPNLSQDWASGFAPPHKRALHTQGTLCCVNDGYSGLIPVAFAEVYPIPEVRLWFKSWPNFYPRTSTLKEWQPCSHRGYPCSHTHKHTSLTQGPLKTHDWKCRWVVGGAVNNLLALWTELWTAPQTAEQNHDQDV